MHTFLDLGPYMHGLLLDLESIGGIENNVMCVNGLWITLHVNVNPIMKGIYTICKCMCPILIYIHANVEHKTCKCKCKTM
jgi:hypothetical protein